MDILPGISCAGFLDGALIDRSVAEVYMFAAILLCMPASLF